jgi:hypothetical protein
VGLSQQAGEAEGSLILGVRVRVGSSPDNAGTGRYRQTVRVRQARRKGVTRVNQWQNPLKRETGSNLVDVGRAATHAAPVWAATPTSTFGGRSGGHEEGLRRTRGEVAGEELGADPVDRLMVNVGTIPGPPFPLHIRCGGGQACCRLMVSGWGGVLVVVRGRESRLHGEGAQRVSSNTMAMAGARR